MKNDDYDCNARIGTQANNNDKNNLIVKNNNINNINNTKIINKSLGLRKIRAINDKNENNGKKDMTANNLASKKRRQKYFDSDIKSIKINSTNILGNNLKNKSVYLNIIRKAFNNKNNNYYINFMTNKNNNNNNSNLASRINDKLTKSNTFVQKSVRDSKSLNEIRNRSKTNFNKDNNSRKLRNVHMPYMSNIIKIINHKDSNRNYSVNQKNDQRNICLNNTDKNKKNNFNNNVNNEIDNDKIKENISNNSINTYSIFISHKNYKEQSKLGLKKIRLFDINDNEIPIMFYQTNGDYDNGKLFNTMMTNINISNNPNKINDDDIINDNIPFITDINTDIYIYFHINNNMSNNIKYIQILNYNNKNNEKICPVRNIEIYKNQNIIYKGALNNDINIISFSNINKDHHYNNIKYSNNIFRERPFSTSKLRNQKNNINNNNIK
jgi:hypothetical protein